MTKLEDGLWFSMDTAPRDGMTIEIVSLYANPPVSDFYFWKKQPHTSARGAFVVHHRGLWLKVSDPSKGLDGMDGHAWREPIR